MKRACTVISWLLPVFFGAYFGWAGIVRQIDLWMTTGSEYSDATGVFHGNIREGQAHRFITHGPMGSDTRWVVGPGQVVVEINDRGDPADVAVEGPLFGMPQGKVPVRHGVENVFDCRLAGDLGQRAVLQELSLGTVLLAIGAFGLRQTLRSPGAQAANQNPSSSVPG